MRSFAQNGTFSQKSRMHPIYNYGRKWRLDQNMPKKGYCFLRT